MKRAVIAVLALLLSPAPLAAKPPSVVADIAPVASLVAMVTGVPTTALLPPGASPHGHALRPSDARKLAQADLVVWVGPALTPWLERSLDTLAKNADRLTLLDAPGTVLLPARQIDDFAAGHDEDPHEHEHEHEHEDDGESDDGHHHHADGTDPHAWLDPRNATLWLESIADGIARLDPENADNYRANAAAAVADIEALSARIEASLKPLADRRFIVFHDSTQYFEHRFGLAAAGALSDSDAADPGPAHIAALRDRMRIDAIACIFFEPQANPGLVATLAEGTETRIAKLDPLGAELPPGAQLYREILTRLAAAAERCLSPH